MGFESLTSSTLLNPSIIIGKKAKSKRKCMQLVGIYCCGILPGLWPFIWSLIIMKVISSHLTGLLNYY